MLSKEFIFHSFSFFGASMIISWLQIRTFGIVFIIGLALLIYKTRCPCVKIIIPETITERFNKIKNSFIQLRHDKPGAFCTILSLIFIVVAIFGHIISGTWIVIFGLMLAGILATRHQFKFIKEEVSEEKSWSSQTTDHDNDEFLPDVDETMLFVLERAGNEAVLNSSSLNNTLGINDNDDDDDNKSEPEIPLDLIIAADCLPEVNENSSDDSDDNNGDDDVLIRFNTKHFNKDSTSTTSSDDDEDSITSGLNFKTTFSKTMIVDGDNIDGGGDVIVKNLNSYNKNSNNNNSNSNNSGSSSHHHHHKQLSTYQQQSQPPTNSSSSMLKNMSDLVPWALVTNLLKTAVEDQQQQQQDRRLNKSMTTSSSSSRRQQQQEQTDPLDDDYVFINSDDLNL